MTIEAVLSGSEQWCVVEGDNIATLRTMPDACVDSVVCDPPYELSDSSEASTARIATKVVLPKNPKIEPGLSRECCLDLLVREIAALCSGGANEGPSASVPVRPVALDDHASQRNNDVEHGDEVPRSGVTSTHGRVDAEAERAEYLGAFFLECADTETMVDAFARAGAGLDSGRVRIGLRVGAAGGPCLSSGGSPVVFGHENVWLGYDTDAHAVGALTRAEHEPVFALVGMRGATTEYLSAAGALVLLGVFQLGGAKLVRASAATRCLAPVLEPDRVRYVILTAHGALAFDLCIHTVSLSSKGFMGKAWDGSRVAYDINVWREVLRVLKPGGHLLAFGGTRTYHRMTCAIEDAGFEIRDSIHWVYGCLSDDTEILINGRWEHHSKAVAGSLAMCYDADRDSYSWQPIQERFEYDVCDTVYRVRSDRTDQLVTKDHRCLVERGGALSFIRAQEAARECAARVPVLEDVRGLLEALPVPHEGAGDSQRDMLEGVCERTIRIEDDGALSNAGTRLQEVRNHVSERRREPREGVLFQQVLGADASQGSVVRQPNARCREVGAVGANEGIEASRIGEDDGSAQPGVEGRDHLLPKAWELPADQVCTMPARVPADGSEGRLCDGASADRGEGNREASSSQRGCASCEPRCHGQHHIEPASVRGQSNAQAVRGSRFTGTDLARFEPVEYSGVVWCVRVPTGAFVARRSGKAFVTGNSGFPKSLDVSKAIDSAAGAERKVIGPKRHVRDGDVSHQAWSSKPTSNGPYVGGGTVGVGLETAPATPSAVKWQGWGTALKPAHEPIVVARKPLAGTVAANVQEYGTGALNIDACRVATNDNLNGGAYCGDGERDTIFVGLGRSSGEYEQPIGRWPSNFVLSHSPGCVRVGRKKVASSQFNGHPEGRVNQVYGKDLHQRAAFPYAPDGTETVDDWRCVDGCPVKMLGEQSGESVSTGGTGTASKQTDGRIGWRPSNTGGLGDTGTASRFFHQFPADPFVYEAKASRSEREAGCESLPAKDRGEITGRDSDAPGCKNPRSGKRASGAIRNTHPTVKPVALMRWCVRLVTPPGGVVLDPYAGSGSTGCGAVPHGFRFIGCELHAEHKAIADARIAWWVEHPGGPTAASKDEAALERAGQLPLLGGAG